MATNFAPILKVDPRAAPRLKSYGIPHGRGNIFLLGRVISFFHLGHNHDPPSGRLSNSDTLTFTGQWIHSKQRKFVVIETYVNHCIVVPIFTYGGRGLRAKASEVKAEYLRIRDVLDPGETNDSDAPNRTILAKGNHESEVWVEGEWQYMSRTAYAHITAPVVFDYNWPCVVEGFVEFPDDRAFLQRCYYQDCSRPHGPEDLDPKNLPVKRSLNTISNISPSAPAVTITAPDQGPIPPATPPKPTKLMVTGLPTPSSTPFTNFTPTAAEFVPRFQTPAPATPTRNPNPSATATGPVLPATPVSQPGPSTAPAPQGPWGSGSAARILFGSRGNSTQPRPWNM